VRPGELRAPSGPPRRGLHGGSHGVHVRHTFNAPDPCRAGARASLHEQRLLLREGEGVRVICDCKARRSLENVRGLVARDRKKIPAEIVEHLLRFCAEGGVFSSPLRAADDAPACPGSECPMCSGEACQLCGAGCWSHANNCEHATDERHMPPEWLSPAKKLAHLTDGRPCWCDPEVRPDGVVIHREAQ
jgi:hypothetical protein